MRTARELIEMSATFCGIITHKHSNEIAEGLLSECDDSAEYCEGGCTVDEYWGRTDDGCNWRVHLFTGAKQ